MEKEQAYKYLGKVYSTTKNDSYRDALAVALAALKNDHSAEADKMVPLTLEQLREMTGQPVWVDFTGGTIKRVPGWYVIKKIQNGEVWLSGTDCVCKSFEYYGKVWLAYAYPPAHINREAWGCPNCTPDSDGYVRKFGAYSLQDSMLETGHCKPQEIKYCPKCGRPLTPEAWDELEKRLRR